MRVGTGYDIHRFAAEGRLVLGGVEFPGQPGLIGHSDADPVMHAIADAVLGAAALGDLGDHFADDSPDWKDADSSRILAEAVRLAAAERSLRPVNVDVSIIAERPRLAGCKEEMRHRLAEVLGVPVDCVSVKARTAEGLGPVGEGLAIEVHAVVLME